MTIELPLDAFIGPVSGLSISLYFAFTLLGKFEKTTERLVSAFEAETKACEERYRQVLDELLRIKEDK